MTRMRPVIICVVILSLYSVSCDKEALSVMDFVIGQNYYTTVVDGDLREYYVHVPPGYTGNEPVPMVLFLHGASGTGLTSYNSSGWREVGDEENILTVYPTSWSFCWIRANGSTNDSTRWNSYPGIFEYCPGEVPRDDVKYLRQVIDEVQATCHVDYRRIYMAGFSSGGQMSFRCAVEMSDVLAAVVQSGGTHQKDTLLTPRRNLPVAIELGNQDDRWFDPGLFPPLHLFDTLLQSYVPFRNIVKAHARTFHYDTTYTLSGDDNVMTATFPGFPVGQGREFTFSLIDSLQHEYPNTVNHPIHGARMHWEWMNQFTLN